MTTIPSKITERRAELERWTEHHREQIESHERSALEVDAEISAIDFCTAAYADQGHSAEAGEAGSALGDTSGAENAPAGICGGQSLGAATDERLVSRTPALGNVSESPSTKKPRAPKRSIRAMVLLDMETFPETTLDQLIGRAKSKGIGAKAVNSAVAYWQAKGELTLEGGVVRLQQPAPERSSQLSAMFSEARQFGEEDGRAGNRDHAARWPSGEYGHADYERGHARGQSERHASDNPVEITGQGAVEVQDMGFLDPEMARQALVGFLTRNPDSTIDELREVGISAADVYRAATDGVVSFKGGVESGYLYALVEGKAEAAAAE